MKSSAGKRLVRCAGRTFRIGGVLGLLLVLSSILSVSSFGQGAPLQLPGMGQQVETGDVTFEVSTDGEGSRPGDVIRIRFDFEITPGWHMYAMDSPAGRPLAIEFTDLPEGITVGELAQSEPIEAFDPNFQQNVRWFEESAVVTATLAIAPTVESGSYPIEGKVRRMICNDKICLPPTARDFETTVVVRANAPVVAQEELEETPVEVIPESDLETGAQDTATVAVPAPGGEDGGRDRDVASVVPTAASGYGAMAAGGIWRFLLLAIGAGLAALLMPCVFPMIPLTVSYFTKHADDRAEAFRMASVYGLAIVLTFTGLGVLMAILVGAAGAQTIAANPWINLTIGLIFIVFALSLLGFFELRLPNGLLNYFNRQSSERSGYAGVLFMGLTLSLVSFSCTAPFVGGLLAATAGGAWSYPVLGMLVFSATFALPFVLFALFPRGLSALPRSGTWMNVVKVVLGFVELAAAIKFLSNADLVWGWGLISRPLAIALTAVILFLAGLYLIGKLPLKGGPVASEIGMGRLLTAVAFFGLSLYFLPGLLGAPLGAFDAYLPPRQATDVSLLAGFTPSSTHANEEDWFVDDLEGAFAEARTVGKPVFIDYSGYTCTNCRQMESNVFPQPDIASRFKNDYVLLRLYTDGLEHGETFQRYQLQKTGTVALPTYAIVTPDEEVVALWSGIASVEEFAGFLDHGRQQYLATVSPSSTPVAPTGL